MGEFKLILNRNSLADILPPGGASRVTGRRDASRVHARSEAGFRRLLEAEAIYREYHLRFVSLRFPEYLEIQLATCDLLTQQRPTYDIPIDQTDIKFVTKSLQLFLFAEKALLGDLWPIKWHASSLNRSSRFATANLLR